MFGAPGAGREWAGPRRTGPSIARLQLPIPRVAGKLAGIRVRESMGNVERLDLRYATEIARAARSLGPPVRYGSQMADLRTGSGILGVRGPVFCFPFVVTRRTDVSRL